MKQLSFFEKKKGTYVDLIDEKKSVFRVWLSKHQHFALDKAKEDALKIYCKQKKLHLTFSENNFIRFGEIMLNGKIIKKGGEKE